nr:8120_t:CDS:2 [Entrophospora candida]
MSKTITIRLGTLKNAKFGPWVSYSSASDPSYLNPKGKSTRKVAGPYPYQAPAPAVVQPNCWVRPQGRPTQLLGQTAAGLSKEQKAALVIPTEIQEVIIGMLISLVGTPPRKSSYYDKRTDNTDVSYAFATFTHPYFTDQSKVWYTRVDGKHIKVLPENIADLVTPIALAYWLSGCRLRSDPTGWTTLRSDPTGWTTAGAGAVPLSGPAPDGSFNKRDGCIEISTDSFTPEEIPKREVPKVQELVKPYIASMMAYRVGLSIF